ncbi:MAG: glycosyltransferase [Streptosporangiales bacterium]|nr:glycosyltransferase [Streptosporangiales bacterium]
MPKLSIVVPFYNVERYFEECLASLAAQTLNDLEVIMVDDGSPDNSVEIAREFAARDPRFRLIRQANAGLGAARNAGAREATGEFLAFVDSDDVIPQYAYAYMIESLERTGSDFASGNVHRFSEYGTRQSPMHRRIFHATVPATHIAKRDSLLVDRLATNKVWRKGFWDEHRLAFPEGVLYEDIAAVIPAHFLAKSVDVMHEPVYLWRERPGDDKSITQDRTHVKGLEDRVRAVTEVSRFLAEQGMTEGKRAWDGAALYSDLRIFLQVLDEADEEFRDRFLDLTNAFMDGMDDSVLRELPAIERLKWHLVRRRLLPELLEVLTFNKSGEMRKARAVRRGHRFYGSYPFFEDKRLGVPSDVYRLGGREMGVRQKTEAVYWEDGRLVIEGRTVIRHLRPHKRWQQRVMAWLVHPGTGRRIPVPARVTYAPEFNLPPDGEAARSDWGGYRIVVDPRRLRLSGRWRETTWNMELWVLNRWIARRVLLGKPISGAVQRPPYREVEPDVWVRPRWSPDGQIELFVGPHPATVTGHRLEGSDLALIGRAGPAAGGNATLRLTRLPGGVSYAYPLEVTGKGDSAVFAVRVPVADLRPANESDLRTGESLGPRSGDTSWRAEIVTSDGGTHELVLGEGVPEERHLIGRREVVIDRSYQGALQVQERNARPQLVAARWTDRGALRLTGRFALAAGERAELVLAARGRTEEHLFPIEPGHPDDTGMRTDFTVEFDPRRVVSLAGALPLPRGNYDLAVRVTGPDGETAETGTDGVTETACELDHAMLGTLPIELETPERTYGFADYRYDKPLIRVGPDLKPDERGAFAQKVLREEYYPHQQREPVRREILFDSYSGKQFSDSPRGMFEELRRRGSDIPAGWIVRDGQVNLPEHLPPVRHVGREYFEKLARSRYIVTNAHLPMWFRRRSGQTLVQTWHGSMLKRIGFDIEHVRFAQRDYHDRLAIEVSQWDYLVSPSPWATPILRQAFRFEGEILETGYPRNDIFFSPEKNVLTAKVRERLGLPADKKVLLYAPTWRDDKFYAHGRYKLDLRLDLERMRRVLGEEYVLLVRRHPNIVDRVPGAGNGFVYDVSVYPEIQELFLVTDVLVTDYSSLMFDFANTGRPMLFFTYDLEEYRDKLRGFYFDFESTAPGPLLTTSDQVIESIADVDAVQEAHATAYQAFVNQFCPLDDGKAAARVVDRVFGDAG